MRGGRYGFGPVAFWIAVGTVVIMAGWSVATATYFAFRDDVLKELMARQAEQQYAYEDRIAELRARIDRTTSRQLLDQEQFEQKLDDLLRRQSTLESRASATERHFRPDRCAAIERPQTPDLSGAPHPAANGALRSSAIRWLAAARAAKRPASPASLRTLPPRSIAWIDASRLRLLLMQERYEDKARKLRGVLADFGFASRSSRERRAVCAGADAGRQQTVSNGRWSASTSPARKPTQFSRSLVSIPIRKPITGEIDISSTFGARTDPFLRVPAMHTGIDFRGESATRSMRPPPGR